MKLKKSRKPVRAFDEDDADIRLSVHSSLEPPISDDDVDEDEYSRIEMLYMLLPIAYSVASMTYMNKLGDMVDPYTYPNDNEERKAYRRKTRAASAAFIRDADLDVKYNSMGNAASGSMVAPNKDGTVAISVPTDTDFRFVTAGSAYISSDYASFPYNREQLAEAAVKIHEMLEKDFGKDYWDIDKGVSMRIPVTPKMFDDFELDKSFIDEEVALVDMMLDWIESIEIVSPAVGAVQRNRKIRNLEDAKKAEQEGDANAVARHKQQVMSPSVRKYTLYVKFNISSNLAKYVVQSNSPDPQNLHTYITAALQASSHDKNFPEMYFPIEQIREQNKGRKSINRINEFNLAIDSKGSPFWVPAVDHVDKFKKAHKAAGFATPMGWTLKSPFEPWKEDAPENALNNTVMYYDDVNSKLTYMANDAIVTRDMQTSIEFEPQHAVGFMQSPIFRTSAARHSLDAFNYYISRMDDLVDKVDIDLSDFRCFEHNGVNIYAFNDYYSWNGDLKDNAFKNNIRELLRNGVAGYIEEVTRSMNATNNYLTQQAAYDDNFDVSDEHRWIWDIQSNELLLEHLTMDTEVKILKPLVQLIELMSERIIAEPLKYTEGRSINAGMLGVGFAFFYQKYLRRKEEIKSKAQPYFDAVAPRAIDKDWKAPALPGVAPNFKYLPHQGRVHQLLTSNPRYAILAVDAGGGKTLIALSKILNLVSENLYKKPLILCPHYLIGNYVQDLITLSQGKWNIIPINRSVVNRHGMEKIAQLVNAAPPNTIFVSDYLFVKGGTYEASYGNTTVIQSEFSEYLLNFGFDAAFCDESHILKNPESQMTIATLKLLSSIKMIYLMSGTIVDGTPQDVYAQVSILDPTIFGSREEFLRDFAVESRNGKVTVWVDNWEKKMWDRINSRIAYIQVKKKEWSALLPDRVEEFHEAILTPDQRKLYQAILEEVLDDIRKDPKIMERFKNSDDENTVDLESLLGPYIARLEQFLTAPGQDRASAGLEEKDTISPKIEVIANIIKKHQKEKIKGKILIFTSYVKSAEAIYDNMPANIKKHMLLYKAADKSKHKAIFLNDDNIQIMVGVEQSLNTGHNFQNTSRIIRVESVWNPGTLEQAESRIFRPDVANKYGIDEKYLDWVIASGTIDVTKAARLMSKVLTKVAFDERDNPLYASIPTVPLVSMNLDTIAQANDFEEDLSEHIAGYQQYRKQVKVEFDQYRKDPNALKLPFNVPSSKMPEGSAYLMEQPYIEGHAIPFQEELGLQGMAEYASEHKEGVDTFDATGMWVHTEFGDGEVVKSSRNTVHVDVKGRKVITEKMKTFVYIDQEKRNKKDAKRRILEMVNMPILSLDDLPKHKKLVPVDLPDGEKDRKPKSSDTKLEKYKQDKEKQRKPVPNTDVTENNQLNLYALSINNQIAVGIDEEDPDVPDAAAMQGLGFTFSGKYAYAELRNKQHMNSLYNFVHTNIEKGNITLPEKLMEDLEAVKEAFDQSRKRAQVIDILSQKELRNFYLMRIKKPKDPKTVFLHFVVEDGVLFALVNLEKGQRGKQFIRRKIKGVNWETDEGSYFAFFRKKADAISFAKGLAKKLTIGNMKDFKSELKSIRVVKRQEKKEE